MEANLITEKYLQLALERLCGKLVENEFGCYEYQGAIGTCGYGFFWFDGRNEYAHRIAWRLENGEILDGKCILHKCDNRKCVNTAHLFFGSHKQNTADMIAKGRQVIVRGEDRSAYRESTIRALKQDLQDGLSRKEVSVKYNMNVDNVKAIARGISWRHV
jgi:hypothetical protein